MQTVTLGRSGPAVGALGLGCMGMSPGIYGPADEAESIATIHAAIEAGVTLIDTGDFYGMGHNEMLIRRALEGMPRSRVVISVKFGALRDPAGAWGGNDCRPQAVKNFLGYTLRRLGTDYVDIYRPARVDPAVPIEDTIGAIAHLVRAGYVRHIGLSELGAEKIRRAQAVHPIADLQIEYSLMSRGIEAAILPTTRQLGIAVTAYGVLSRGLLSGRIPAADAKGDIRVLRMPRFKDGNRQRNLGLVEALRRIGAEKGASPGAARHRLGFFARERHRPGRRRPPPRPARGGARRARAWARCRRSRAHRRRGFAEPDRRRALRRAAAGAPRQRSAFLAAGVTLCRELRWTGHDQVKHGRTAVFAAAAILSATQETSPIVRRKNADGRRDAAGVRK